MVIATTRSSTFAGAVVAAALAVGLTASGRAELAKVVKAPRGVVLNCSPKSAGGAPGGTFRAARNLIIGPIAMTGAAERPVGYSAAFPGNKFPLYMRGGHRVTLAIAARTRGAKLVYGGHAASRVLTFISCRRDELAPENYAQVACCFSFWAGGVVAASARCVHLLAWVDDEPHPRRAVIYLGVPDCG